MSNTRVIDVSINFTLNEEMEELIQFMSYICLNFYKK